METLKFEIKITVIRTRSYTLAILIFFYDIDYVLMKRFDTRKIYFKS